MLLSRRVTQFLKVYECGKIHQASEELGMSQPALSVSLKHLENALGIDLFERSVKGLSPTAAGETLYRYACNLRLGERHALEEIAEHRDGQLGTLRVGAGVAWTTTILPGVLNTIHEQYPRLTIDLVTGVGDQLASLFVSGRLDVFLAAGPVNSLDTEDIRYEHLQNLKMIAMADAGSRLATMQAVSIAELAAVDWAGFYEDESIVNLANQYLASRGLQPARIIMRTNSAASLNAFVHDSELATILISPLVESARAAGLAVLPLAEPLWELPVNVYYRKVVADKPMIRGFVDLVRQRMTADC